MNSSLKSEYTINTFSLKDHFWARFPGHMVSFTYEGMQADVHISIAFNDNSPDVNLHLTRNTSDASNKPKIEIARISKKELDEIAGYLPNLFFEKMLRPVRFKRFGRKKNRYHYGTYYLPYDNLEETEFGKLLYAEWEGLAFTKKNKVKINANLTSHFTKVIKEKGLEDKIAQKLRWLPVKHQQNCSAFIVSKGFTGVALFIAGNWYTIRQDIDFKKLCCALMTEQLFKSLWFKTVMAYARIRHLSSRDESLSYDRPFILNLIH